MKSALILIAAIPALVVSAGAQQPTATDLAAWKRQAQNVTITRDDWGIAHIHGKTDADAIFGLEYAQAEDDFNRVETNYINAMGRLAEAEGESQIYRDLRMKLFINPDTLKALYAKSPDWLKKLMNAYADGLNFYLATHPNVTPRVIKHFEPWMALSFTEGSIGGDIEKVNLNQLEAFYGGHAPASTSGDDEEELYKEPSGSNGIAIAPANTVNHHALLLINPHTSFFFRSEVQVTSDEGLNAYGAVTWGQIFIYQGFNQHVGWMHTSSGVDAEDEFLETVTKKGRRLRLQARRQGAACRLDQDHGAVQDRVGHGDEGFHRLLHAARTGRPRTERQVGRRRSDERAGAGTHAVVHAHQGDRLQVVPTVVRAAHQLVEQHDLRRRAGRHRVLPRQLHPEARPEVRLDAPRRRQRSRPRTTRACSRWTKRRTFSTRRAAGSTTATTGRGPRRGRRARSSPTSRRTSRRGAPSSRAGTTRSRCCRVARTSRWTTCSRRSAFDSYMPSFEKMIPPLIKAYDATPASDPVKAKVADQIAVLRPWDYRWGANSVATSLAVFWGEDVTRRVSTGRRGGGGGGGSAEDLVAAAPAATLLQSLAAASDKLTADFGTWKTPWGDINRFQRINDDINSKFDDAGPSIPVPFASARWGTLASFGARAYPNTKKWYGTSGNSFVAVVEFGDSVRARAVTAGGESGNPSSKHFNDEATRYASGNLREVYFYPSQLKAHTERAYHPGE